MYLHIIMMGQPVGALVHAHCVGRRSSRYIKFMVGTYMYMVTSTRYEEYVYSKYNKRVSGVGGRTKIFYSFLTDLAAATGRQPVRGRRKAANIIVTILLHTSLLPNIL